MMIASETLCNLYERYNSFFVGDYTKSQEVFNKAFQAIEDQLNDYFDWERIAEESTTNPELLELLKHSLMVNHESNALQFDELSCSFNCNRFAQLCHESNRLKLASASSDWGIQERFLKSSDKEASLSKLDIQRHIVQTNMVGQIGVVDANKEAIGLYIANAKLIYEQQRGLNPHRPYTLALMLNCNPQGEAQWASLVITVNPETNNAHYNIIHGPDLTAAHLVKLSSTINEAIKFTATSEVTGLPLEAYPDITLAPENITKVDDGSYQVLHQLYNHPALANVVHEKANARAFKEIEPKLSIIKPFVHNQQIQSIKIEPEIFSLFSEEPKPQHTHVNEVMQEVRITDSKITFPRSKQEKLLSAQDYQTFILLLKNKFDSVGVGNGLKELAIKVFDLNALQGLARLKGQATTLPFEKLTLELPELVDADNKAAFKFNLKLALISLSESNLAQMELVDTNTVLNDADIAELTDFIEKNNISINITLPQSFVRTSYQKRVDIASSQFILDRNAHNFLTTGDTIQLVPVARTTRTRPELASTTLSIDIELQQEVQVEVAVEGSAEKETDYDPSAQYVELFSLERFRKAISRDVFSPESKSYLIPAGHFVDELWCNWLGCFNAHDALSSPQLSKQALEEIMRHADKFQYGLGLIKQGEEYRNLPAGFTVKKNGQHVYIDFDPKLKLIAEINPLAVQTKVTNADTVLSVAQIQKWIEANPNHPFKAFWAEQIGAAQYNKQALHALQLALPKIVQMPIAQVEELFKLSKTEGQMDVAKFNFLVHDSEKARHLVNLQFDGSKRLKNHLDQLFGSQSLNALNYINNFSSVDSKLSPLLSILNDNDRTYVNTIQNKVDSVKPNGLLQLYLKCGSKGLRDLGILLDNAGETLPLYQKIISAISVHQGSYQHLLTSEFQEALKIFSGLPEHERLFFLSLFEQHAQYNPDVDFAQLMGSFSTFKEELKALAPEGQEFSLPKICHLSDVKSMPLALSRIVALVRHVKQEERQIQLYESHRLDLSSTGMIQAITRNTPDGKRWNFITHEMQLSLSHEKSKNRAAVYKSPVKYKLISGIDRGLSEDFFRYVGLQTKKGSLSMEFYRKVAEKVEQERLKTSWSLATKQNFYKLIAASTTSEDNTKFVTSTEQAIADFESVFKKIDVPPNPSGLAHLTVGSDTMRLEILDSLNSLENIPPLPVLSRLVTLISNTLSSVFNLVTGTSMLNDANDSLDYMTKPDRYGNLIYQGMLCYSDSDYADGKLFFQHMDAVKEIHNKTSRPYQYSILGSFLVQLISAFHLKTDPNNVKKDSLKQVLDVLLAQEDNKLGPITVLLDLLTKIDHEKYTTLPPLSHHHLLALLKAMNSSEPKEAIDVIKEFKVDENGPSLVEYFDSRFIQNYGKPVLSEEIRQKIAQQFDEGMRSVVEDILSQFTAPTDANQYNLVLDKLIGICKNLSKSEQNLFLSKLFQAKGLYSTAEPLSSEKNNFIQLLNLIDERGSPDELLNLIASDNALFSKLPLQSRQQLYTGVPPCHEGLDQKAVLFIRAIYPKIKTNEHLPFSKIEITPRLHEWLLKTPAAQLEQISAVTHPDNEKAQTYLIASQVFLDAFKEDSSSNKLDLVALKNAANILEKNSEVPNKEALQSLQEKLTLAKKIQFVSPLALIKIKKNPPVQELFSYFSNQMSDAQKAAFERVHGDFIEQHVIKYHHLKNEGLMSALLDKANFTLLKNTFQGDSLKALQSPNLLTDETIFCALLKGLDQDAADLKALKESVESIHSDVKQYQEDLSSYARVILNLVDKLAALVNENPAARGQFLALFDKFVANYEPAQGEMMLALHDFADKLAPVVAMMADKNVVLSLFMQFNGDEELQPEDLLKLIATVQSVEGVGNQKLLINVAVNLLNNKKGYTLGDGSGNDFTKLCTLAKDSQFVMTLQAFYKKPPYPDLEQIINIHTKALNTADYALAIQTQAQQFDKSPCHRELEVNGFHVEKALTQLEQFKGYKATRETLEGFYQKTVEMRDKSSEELLHLLQTFHPDSPVPNKDMQTLVAVAAELFYRSQGKDAFNADGTPKLGSSMEINTTQYLAILSSLETQGHVTSQIGTGEGKSRIMMISNVCQWALGNTVDFVTSDAQLATRDYVEYQAFFNMVGAQTSMIFAHSDPSLYQVGGINFSDPSNLSLFRNKAKSLGKGEQVLAQDSTRRALMLDEADKTYFDVADTRFNYSKEGDESIQNMSWIYRILMEYFEQTLVSVDKSIALSGAISPQQLFYANVDASRESFLAFAGSKCSRQDFMRLKALSEQQIEQWQVSAVTASQLQFKKDFVIAPDELISTPKGPKISSEAQLLFANRVAKGSKFSFGVHQCLHARLNHLRHNPQQVENDELRRALGACEQGFYVADEKQIVYSSSSKNLIDDYTNGTLKAVTGTAGSEIERAEARTLYNRMNFIDVPRDRGLIRQDKGVQVCKDDKAQLKSLIVNIRAAQAKNQPILIIAENDEESGKLFGLLQKHFPEDIQRIHSQLNSKEEQEKTKDAGLPRMITVSTDMIGRGTDIELRKRTLSNGKTLSSAEHGLSVMVTYLPRVRDLEQIIGRSGRFGAKGDTSLLLDKPRLLKKLSLNELPKDFVRNTQGFIQREQAKMDRKAQVERLIKNHVGDFRMVLQENFFTQMLTRVPNAAKKNLLSCWTSFFEKSDKAWNEVWPHIQKQLQQPNLTQLELDSIEVLLERYKREAQKEWQFMIAKVKDLEVSCLDNNVWDSIKQHLQKPVITEEELTILKAKLKEQTQQPNFTTTELNEIKIVLETLHAVTPETWVASAAQISAAKMSILKDGQKANDILSPQTPDLSLDKEVKNLFTSFKVIEPEVPKDTNRFKKILGGVFAFIGAAIGVALIATGVLAPLGIGLIATAAIAASVGGMVGGAVGVSGGAIADLSSKSEDSKALKIDLDEDKKKESSAQTLNIPEDKEQKNRLPADTPSSFNTMMVKLESSSRAPLATDTKLPEPISNKNASVSPKTSDVQINAPMDSEEQTTTYTRGMR